MLSDIIFILVFISVVPIILIAVRSICNAERSCNLQVSRIYLQNGASGLATHEEWSLAMFASTVII